MGFFLTEVEVVKANQRDGTKYFGQFFALLANFILIFLFLTDKKESTHHLAHFKMRSFLLLILGLIYFQCQSVKDEDPKFQEALENGYLAHEGFKRCLDYVTAWLEFADPRSGLIPKNLTDSKDFWNAKDAAADNYPFMVLTASLLDKEMYNGSMMDILETEQRLTNRLNRLPDAWSFSKQNFVSEEIDMDEIIFGSSEYVKDGLLSLTEYIGNTPWSDRMIGMVDDIWKNATYETPFGMIPSKNVEVNGELMQVLSRVYWMTGEEKYLDWAIRLGDYYLLGKNHPTRDSEVIRLRDHGCEIVSGLCELYLTTAFANSEKKAAYQPQIYEMLDRILEVGTNEDGLFYNQVNPITGEILDSGIADTWGYTFNAYYSVYMLDGHQPYKDALLKAFDNLHEYTFFDWERGSQDGYADAIESALNLYNRERVSSAREWIDSETQVMWSMQDSAHRSGTAVYRGNGILEGWHGDGNFARTTIMYCLYKTMGTTISPWNENVYFGAVQDGEDLKVSILSNEDWTGKIHFDYARHKQIFNLPLDYPRINQFPEWFTVEPSKSYLVHFVHEGKTRRFTGIELIDGIEVITDENIGFYLIVEPHVE